MAIPEKEMKLLWGRAAGRCSAPGCRVDLTPVYERTGSTVLGEMAHIIGRKPTAARSHLLTGADDTYANLILLCPSHHTAVDKAEADFPVEVLRKWKSDWEEQVAGLNGKVSSRADLFREIGQHLTTNSVAFTQWGPASNRATSFPLSQQAADTWHSRRVEVIVPNNTSIIVMLRQNKKLLSAEEWVLASQFIEHATAFQMHCLRPREASAYVAFPIEFADMIRKGEKDG